MLLFKLPGLFVDDIGVFKILINHRDPGNNHGRKFQQGLEKFHLLVVEVLEHNLIIHH